MLSSVDFDKPVKVIQIFRNIYTYGKDERSFSSRKDKLAWKPIPSTSGHVADQVLYLPPSLKNMPAIGKSVLIFLLDDQFPIPEHSVFEQEKVQFASTNQHFKLNSFRIWVQDVPELHFKYEASEVGMPARADFKIAELKPSHPICVKVNGKFDFSLTGRRARTYIDQTYIFEHLGEVSSYAFLKEPLIPLLKTVPTAYKLIDLNKTLF